MKTPPPINGVRTRVQRIGAAEYHAEYTRDSLTWHSLEGFTRNSLDDAKAICERFKQTQAIIPPVGITVWEDAR